VALDLNPAQVACLELRVAAYRTLAHPELLELVGSVPSGRRLQLYARCRAQLSPPARTFWDCRPREIVAGIGGAGRFERYLALFRRQILPLAHNDARVARLLRGGTAEECAAFFDKEWDTWRWRVLVRLFCSRAVVGRLGRDAAFFRHAEGGLATQLLGRLRHVLATQNPATNPYLHWMLTGRHGDTLPYALRAEHFDAIRDNLDRLELRVQSIEGFLEECGPRAFDRFNLSDVFEYISAPGTQQLLDRLAQAGRPGARLAYWNMLVARSRPSVLAHVLCPLEGVAERLGREDKVPFYSRFVVEEVYS
jgi:S-adenosylmethionine-diacylglycerol 3-amino-3-carboxypropyl transferase